MSESTTRQDADLVRQEKLSPQWLGSLIVLGVMLWGQSIKAEEIAKASPGHVTVVIADPVSSLAIDEAASSSSIVSDRTPRGLETVPQLLAEQPGVAMTRSGGLGSTATLSLRGSAPNQVPVFVDGVPYSSASIGGVDMGLMAIGHTDQMEIFRGQTPIAFPTSGLGGVVSIYSQRPDRSQGLVRLGSGSFGTYYGDGLFSHVTPRTAVSIQGQGLTSRGNFPYTNDGGTIFLPSDDQRTTRQNNALSQKTGRFRGSVELPSGRRLTAIAGLLDRAQGIPALSYLTSKKAHLDTQQWMATTFYESPRDLGLASTLRAQIYGLGTRQRFSDPNAEVAVVPTATNDRTYAVGGTLTAQKMMWDWLRWSVLIATEHESFSPSSGDQSIGPEGTRTSGVVGGEWDFAVDDQQFHLIPSIRIEANRDAIAHRERYAPNLFSSTLPTHRWLPVLRFALLKNVGTTLTVRGNLGRYGRMPSLFERYGNNGRILGNSDLRPETGINADLGLRWSPSSDRIHFHFDLAVFGARVKDLIQFQMIPPRMRPENVGAARVLGVEACIQGTYGRWGRIMAQTTFTDARNQSGRSGEQGHQLPLRPRLRAYVRPEVRGAPFGKHLQAGLYSDLDLTSENYQDTTNLRRFPTRVLFGAGLYVEKTSWGLRLLANMENLTNRTAVDLAGYPLPGRSIFFTLAFTAFPASKESES